MIWPKYLFLNALTLEPCLIRPFPCQGCTIIFILFLVIFLVIFLDLLMIYLFLNALTLRPCLIRSFSWQGLHNNFHFIFSDFIGFIDDISIFKCSHTWTLPNKVIPMTGLRNNFYFIFSDFLVIFSDFIGFIDNINKQ